VATLGQLREGLRARLATISGLRTYDEMPPKPEPPAAAVLPTGWDYGQTFDGAVTWRFDVWLYVSPADLTRAQQRFDEYLAPTGASSIAAAIEGDVSLGGLSGVYARVLGARAYAQLVDVAGSQLLGGSLQVEVYSS
jgi:hypothetical protein